jgi:gamma-glutamyltranspeptidase
VLKHGKPFLAISTPGGDSQDQQILNVLLQMIVLGFDIQDDRGATHQLAAPVRLVRQPGQRSGSPGD